MLNIDNMQELHRVKDIVAATAVGEAAILLTLPHRLH